MGVDPGVHTGLAVWNVKTRNFELLRALKLHEALDVVTRIHALGRLRRVVFEDARLRRWFGAAGREQLQGAGSVKRDCGVWQEFLEDSGMAYEAVSPQAKGRKLDAAAFKRLTGWTASTNEHARDAAMLVYGR